MAANLPDLFLLSVFKKLSLRDRLSAYQVCSNWYQRVLEVNQAVRCLYIRVIDNKTFETYCNTLIEKDIYGHIPNVKQLLVNEAESENTKESDREVVEVTTKWNTLHFSLADTTELQLNSSIVQHIITAFPFATQLNYVNESRSGDHYKYLIELLESNQNNNRWSRKLTTLRVMDINRISFSDAETNRRFYTAINNLLALKRLAIGVNNESKGGLHEDDLPVLGRLEEILFRQETYEDFLVFFSSVQKYAAENADIQITMPSGLPEPWDYQHVLKSISKPTQINSLAPNRLARKKIVFLNDYTTCECLSYLKFLCSYFPNLTSLKVDCPSLSDCPQYFSAFSHLLPNLLHLMVRIGFVKDHTKRNENAGQPENNQLIIHPHVSSILSSVKVLELYLTVTSHNTDVQWLNLALMVPNVQAIYFYYYRCEQCNVSSCNFELDGNSPDEQAIRQCFGAVVMRLYQATSFPLEKITFCAGECDYTISATHLFA